MVASTQTLKRTEYAYTDSLAAADRVASAILSNAGHERRYATTQVNKHAAAITHR